MSRYSKETYVKIFDQLLSEELYFNSSFASESNIKLAIKRVLGKAVKMNYIALYQDLVIDSLLDVHFTIKDPEGDIFHIDLKYGE